MTKTINIQNPTTRDNKSPLMAEIHQRQHRTPVEIVVPNTCKAEAMVGEMNRQLPAFLKHYLGDKGFTIPHQPLTIKIVGSTSSGGVHYNRFHLHTVLGLPLPPPKMNIFNQPHLRFHTGLRHVPRAPNDHLKLIFLCGSWHQPRAPNPFTDFQLVGDIQVHDEQQGTIRTQEKEALQREIKEEMEMGFEGFLDMDKLLSKVTLEDLEKGGGERQEYWLLAVKAACAEKRLVKRNATVDT